MDLLALLVAINVELELELDCCWQVRTVQTSKLTHVGSPDQFLPDGSGLTLPPTSFALLEVVAMSGGK